MTGEPRLANAEMARIWDGEEGEDWTRNEQRYNAAVAQFDQPLFAAAAIASADVVLDVGCGCGATTREAARRARDGLAVGADLSARMLDRARSAARRDGIHNVEFLHADAQVHPFVAQSFDVVISRFGAMFFDDPRAAFGNMARALRSGGRLVLLGWQELARNAWMTTIRAALAMGRSVPEPVPGQPGPFGLANPDDVRRLLVDAGFERPDVSGYTAPVWLGASVDDATAFVGGMGMTRGLLADLDEDASASALERLRSSLAGYATARGVLLDGAAWLITARR